MRSSTKRVLDTTSSIGNQPWEVEPRSGRSPEVDTPRCHNVVVAYRSTNKTAYSAKYHIIWCPKYRRRVLVGKVEGRLKQIIADVVADIGGQVIEVEVMADHVHLLVEVPPPVALSRLVQLLKGRSSRVLRTEFGHLRRGPALWSPSWFVSTVGGAPLEVVRRYVENQKAAA
jgi:putative transposase